MSFHPDATYSLLILRDLRPDGSAPILSAVERRVGSFVLMSLVPRLSADLRRFGEDQGVRDLAAYERALRPIDAVNYLPHAAPNAVFLQFGLLDTRPSPADGREAAAATSSPKKVEWYDGDHDLNEQARLDRANWLAERLGLD